MMPDTLAGYSTFGVDHYKPQKLFKNLATTYSNLYYCCNACNSSKNNHWPALGKEKDELIPNPCDHVMFEHLRFNNAEVEHKSKAGEFTKILLDLNDPVVVHLRKTMLATIGLWQSKEREVKAFKSAIQAEQKTGVRNAASCVAALAAADAELVEIGAWLAVYAGGEFAPTKAPPLK